jgi:hypothetical protein
MSSEQLDMLPGEYRDDTWQSDEERNAERSLREAIERVEAAQGAYAADLSEQLLSLGLALQKQQRHVEAVSAFKRGVHLARVNSGLYCPEQIPLLQGEVRSQIALGQYAEADELQQYLYRVQQRSMVSGEARADALMQQANWQFNAHRMGLGWQGPGRLSNMWELYRMAFTDILGATSETSPKLLPPLYGMLRTQYLISEYHDDNTQYASGPGASGINQNMNQFYSNRSENYERGDSILAAIHEIQRSNHGEASIEAVGARIQQGDWALWNDKTDAAIARYGLASKELAALDAAQKDGHAYLVEPAPLPDLDGLRTLPPTVSAEQGNILVEFEVDTRGTVRDLERLDDNAASDDAALRLLREIRATRFRPRFEDGEPIATGKLVRAYDIKP